MQISWKFNTVESIELNWHGSSSAIQVHDHQAVLVADVKHKTPPIRFHFENGKNKQSSHEQRVPLKQEGIINLESALNVDLNVQNVIQELDTLSQ